MRAKLSKQNRIKYIMLIMSCLFLFGVLFGSPITANADNFFFDYTPITPQSVDEKYYLDFSFNKKQNFGSGEVSSSDLLRIVCKNEVEMRGYFSSTPPMVWNSVSVPFTFSFYSDLLGYRGQVTAPVAIYSVEFPMLDEYLGSVRYWTIPVKLVNFSIEVSKELFINLKNVDKVSITNGSMHFISEYSYLVFNQNNFDTVHMLEEFGLSINGRSISSGVETPIDIDEPSYIDWLTLKFDGKTVYSYKVSWGWGGIVDGATIPPVYNKFWEDNIFELPFRIIIYSKRVGTWYVFTVDYEGSWSGSGDIYNITLPNCSFPLSKLASAEFQEYGIDYFTLAFYDSENNQFHKIYENKSYFPQVALSDEKMSVPFEIKTRQNGDVPDTSVNVIDSGDFDVDNPPDWGEEITPEIPALEEPSVEDAQSAFDELITEIEEFLESISSFFTSFSDSATSFLDIIFAFLTDWGWLILIALAVIILGPIVLPLIPFVIQGFVSIVKFTVTLPVKLVEAIMNLFTFQRRK